jgi:hypothetical protein
MHCSLRIKPLKLNVVKEFGPVHEIRYYTNLIRSDGVLTWKVDSISPIGGGDMNSYNLAKSLAQQQWDDVEIRSSPKVVVIVYYREPWKNGHSLMRQSVSGVFDFPTTEGKSIVQCNLNTLGEVYRYTHCITGEDPKLHENDPFPISTIEMECQFVGGKNFVASSYQSIPSQWNHQRCVDQWRQAYTEFEKQGYQFDMETTKKMDWATVYQGTCLLGPVSTVHLAEIPHQKVDDQFLLSLLLISVILNLGIQPSINLDELVNALKERNDKTLWTNVTYTAMSFISNSLPYVDDIRLDRDGVKLMVEAVTHAFEIMGGDCEDLIAVVCCIYWAAKHRVIGSNNTKGCSLTLNGKKCTLSDVNASYLLDSMTNSLKETTFGMLLCVIADSPKRGKAHASGLIRYEKTGVCHIIDSVEATMLPMDEAHAMRNKELNRTQVSRLERFTQEDVRYSMSMYHVDRNLISDLHPVRLFKIPSGTELCLDPIHKTIGTSFGNIQNAKWVRPQVENDIAMGDVSLKYPLMSLTKELARFDISILSASSWPGIPPDTRVHMPYGIETSLNMLDEEIRSKAAVMRITNPFLNVLVSVLWQ